MTKAELIAKGRKFGLSLSNSLLKGDLEKAVAKAEKAAAKAKASKATARGEK